MKRWVSEDEEAAGVSVLKDLNFSCDGLSAKDLAKNAPRLHGKLHIGNATVDAEGLERNVGLRDLLVAQLKKDVDWMKEQNIMDYSLLLGIAKLDGRQASRRSLRTEVGDRDATTKHTVAAAADGEFRSIFQVDGGGLRGRDARGRALGSEDSL